MTVEVTIREGRGDLVLRRPDVLNAMNWELFDALAAAVDRLAADPTVRVVVVSGEGRALSSGIDTASFGDLADGPSRRSIERAQAGFRKLAALGVPTIARVHGYALGAGLQLALACDLRVASTDATMGLLEHRFGIVPDLGGTQRLPGLVRPGVAKMMIWSQERIDGREAARRGLVEVCVPPDELDRTVDELAARIAAAPPTAARAVKRLVDLAGSVDLDTGMDAERDAQLECLASPDFAEAIAAFTEGRAPGYGDGVRSGRDLPA